MTTALEGGEGSAPRPGRSLPPGKTRFPLYRRLGTDIVLGQYLKKKVCGTVVTTHEFSRQPWAQKKILKHKRLLIKTIYPLREGRDSSVGIANCYGMDGPRIESRWGPDFPHPSRPALGPTQPPVQWVLGLSWG